MRTEPVQFHGAQGQTLAARLDRPDGTPRAYALFVHRDESSKAAVRISGALAARGVAVLRLDLGLGDSEGDVTGFSAHARDLLAAGDHMVTRGQAPALLIGHGLGGAAALAAAAEMASVKAVATIGAPADPAPDQDLPARIRSLGRALLVLHSPIDAVVRIDNASAIFLPARHPKSFVSLDTADHLLTRGEDADYAAAVIAAWASRYIDLAADPAPEGPAGAVLVQETGAGKFQVQVSVHGARFLADEPADVGGLGSGPSPYELVAAGLGACTAMTLRLYAERKGWPLQRTRVAVRHAKVAGQAPPDLFDRQIDLQGPLDGDQRARLFEIADKCPVHRTLEGGARVTTQALPPPQPSPRAEPEEHFREMEDACREADAAC